MSGLLAALWWAPVAPAAEPAVTEAPDATSREPLMAYRVDGAPVRLVSARIAPVGESSLTTDRQQGDFLEVRYVNTSARDVVGLAVLVRFEDDVGDEVRAPEGNRQRRPSVRPEDLPQQLDALLGANHAEERAELARNAKVSWVTR